MIVLPVKLLYLLTFRDEVIDLFHQIVFGDALNNARLLLGEPVGQVSIRERVAPMYGGPREVR